VSKKKASIASFENEADAWGGDSFAPPSPMDYFDAAYECRHNRLPHQRAGRCECIEPSHPITLEDHAPYPGLAAVAAAERALTGGAPMGAAELARIRAARRALRP
jgi:hypothetical protein